MSRAAALTGPFAYALSVHLSVLPGSLSSTGTEWERKGFPHSRSVASSFACGVL